MNAPWFDLSIIGPPLLAGLLVVLTHVPLGREVLSRGIIFIDLAIAQIAGLGVILGDVLGAQAGSGGWTTELLAGGSALLGALLLYTAERRWPEIQEAIIGSVFVLAASGALLLLAGNPHGAEHLRELLTGQILWVGMEQLWPAAALYAVVLGAWFGWRRGGSLRFYLLFALAVTASVQLVGVYLVFASLIVPALAARRLSGAAAIVTGYAVGALGYALGLVGSAWFDLPAGPMVVWLLAATALVAARLVRMTRVPQAVPEA